MNAKERMMAALAGQKPDRLPVTIHQWQPYHLKTYMNGMTDLEAFIECGLDAAITYYKDEMPDSGQWVHTIESTDDRGSHMLKHSIDTPKGLLTYCVGVNEMTSWMTEHLIKQYDDIYLLRDYRPVSSFDRQGLTRKYDQLADHGIMRVFITGLQGSCWQDACELYGVEKLIIETFDNPDWVHEFLEILLDYKIKFIEKNLSGLPIDLIETGGGAGSNTIISPELHRTFCLPYDQRLHKVIKSYGFPVVYHTCGGMTKIADSIITNGCDASETLSPSEIGGDIDNEATAKILYTELFPKVSLIGGLDQINILEKGMPGDVRNEAERLFNLFGQKGGYMLSACDHFFNAPVENLKALGEAAKNLQY